MKPLKKSTLVGLCDQLAAHPWKDAELEELAHPKLGIITGFQNLLSELETLRKLDLGTTAPATNVQKPGKD